MASSWLSILLVPNITQMTTKLSYDALSVCLSVSLSYIWRFQSSTKKAVDGGFNTFQSGDTPNQKQNECANTHYLPPAETHSNVISKKNRASCRLGPYRCISCGFPWQGWHLTAERYCGTFERLRPMISSQEAWVGARLLSFCTIRPDLIIPDLSRPHNSGFVTGYWEIHGAPFLQSTYCAQWFASLHST